MKRTILLPIATIALLAVILAGTSRALSGMATENGRREHLHIMQTLLPGSTTFTVEPYTGDDANIVSVHRGENGFVIETVTNGYVDEIRMLIGVSNDGKVTEWSVEFWSGNDNLTAEIKEMITKDSCIKTKDGDYICNLQRI